MSYQCQLLPRYALCDKAQHIPYTATQFFWYFSITLEALAMIPQYLLLLALGSVDHTTLVFIICQG